MAGRNHEWAHWFIVVCSIPIAFLINGAVPNPYMDEIFHIPQVQCYCEGRFDKWDDMITTFPGLYLTTLIYVPLFLPLKLLSRQNITFSDLCSVPIIRSINIIFAALSLYLFLKLAQELQEDGSLIASKYFLTSAILALYPLHFFFTFLFYTDVGSTAAVMAMYLAHVKKRFHLCAFFAGVAILFRQTNAIWACFSLALSAIDIVREKLREDSLKVPTDENLDAKNKKITSGLRQRVKLESIHRDKDEFSRLASKEMKRLESKNVFVAGTELVKQMWHFKEAIFIQLSPLVFVILAFIVFVFVNGGIVVGAKNDHKMALHLVQPFYFVSTAVIAKFPLLSSHFLGFLRFSVNLLKKRTFSTVFLTVSALVTGICVVHFFSIAHPYLLADNRHYTFYIWRKIINRNSFSRYLLVPFYMFSAAILFYVIAKKRSFLWITIFSGAVVAVLVPSPLLELRYFTVPICILVLNLPSGDQSVKWVTVFCYVVVNFVTVFLFLYRPFSWEGHLGSQRFIW